MDEAVASWRRQRRAALLAMRRTIPAAERHRTAEIIASKLDALVRPKGRQIIGLYWPIKHEINLLHWAETLADRGGVVLCLPVVVTPRSPLEYWRWVKSEPLSRGFWDIPVPAHRDVMIPDLVLAPMIGFDKANYRLGYGSGCCGA